MSGEKMEKEIEETLNKFLYALEDFLQINAEYSMDDIKVVYATQWQLINKKMVARGVVKIGEAHYAFELLYNIHSNKLVIKAKPFLFCLSYDELEDFLAQAETEGDNA